MQTKKRTQLCSFFCLQFYSPMASLIAYGSFIRLWRVFTAICKYNLSKCRLKLLKIAEKALALGGDFLINFVKEIRLGLAA